MAQMVVNKQDNRKKPTKKWTKGSVFAIKKQQQRVNRAFVGDKMGKTTHLINKYWQIKWHLS